MERMSLALHYGLGNQDIDFSPNAQTISTGYSFYSRDLDDEDPKPVTNYIGEALAVEMAALGKRKLVSKVVPKSNDPKVEIAAAQSTEILLDKLRTLGWAELRKQGLVYFTNCGSITYKTCWDEVYSNTRTQGSADAVKCNNQGGVDLLTGEPTEGCNFKLSSPFINTEQRNKFPQIPSMAAPAVKEQEDTFNLLACPECDEGLLEPYSPLPDELEEEDMFGRPMGQEVPVGNVNVELYTPFQQFIQNNGVGITPNTVKLQGYVSAKSMDWLVDHYPELQEVDPDSGAVTMKIDPDPSDELMEHHELLGEAALRYSYTIGVGDPNIFDDHKLVYEVCQDKSYRFPQGRYAVLVKGLSKPLEDGPLYIEVDHPSASGQKIEVPKVKFHTARYKIRAGEWWGKGLPDDLISSQNVLNATDAMIIDAFERMGSPNMLIPQETNAQGPEWTESGGRAGKFLRYQVDPVAAQYGLKPEALPGQGMTTSIFNWRTAKLEDLRKLGAPKDVELGEAPRNITTTTGLQLLSEQADRMRADAEDALVEMYEKMWRHILELLWAFRVEEDEDYYEVETSSGAWERKQITNTLIAGQTHVKIEKQAYVDKSVFWKEAVREAQIDGLYDPNSPLSAPVRIKLLEARGLPTEMVESENLQVKAARRQWIDFKEEGLIPTIDKTLDNPHIRYEELGNLLLTNDGRELAEAAGWPEISRRIAGWEDTFAQALQADQAAREFYGGWLPPELAEQRYMEAQQQHQQQVMEHQAIQQEAANITLQDPQTAVPQGYLAPPPEPPPPPQFLPNSMEDKILQVWTQVTQQQLEPNPMTGEMQPKPLPEPNYPKLQFNATNPEEGRQQAAAKQEDFLRFRAVFEAYKVLADQDMQAQLMGEMEAPSPASQDQQRPSPFSKPLSPPEAGGDKV
jgi:hypothetical protein